MEHSASRETPTCRSKPRMRERAKAAARVISKLDTCSKFQGRDRKSTRLNSSHSQISYAVFCLKTKNLLNNVGDTFFNCSVSLLCAIVLRGYYEFGYNVLAPLPLRVHDDNLIISSCCDLSNVAL